MEVFQSKRVLIAWLWHSDIASERLEHRATPACAVEHWVPGYVGRPAEYKTLLPLVGAGNTWGVVTSVPACSTVPARAVDGTRAMSLIKDLLARLGRWRDPPKNHSGGGVGQLQIEALVRANGDWLALLATILERESVITSAELAGTLAEFAALTAEDRPAEGQILAFWASRLNDTTATIRNFPSVH